MSNMILTSQCESCIYGQLMTQIKPELKLNVVTNVRNIIMGSTFHVIIMKRGNNDFKRFIIGN